MSSEQERELARPSGLVPRIGEAIKRKKEDVLDFFGINVYRMVERYLEEQERVVREVVLRDLESEGLLGKHQPLSLPNIERGQFGNLKGEIIGGFFLFAGSIKGEIEGHLRTCSTVQFAWEPVPGKGVIISEIPIDKFVFQEGEVEIPELEFIWNGNYFTRFVTLDPPRFFTKRFPHPNDYLNSEGLTRIIATIDPKTRKLLPLPQSQVSS